MEWGEDEGVLGRVRAAVRRAPWWSALLLTAFGCAVLRVAGPWRGWEPGLWVALVSAVVVAARQWAAGRAAMDVAMLLESSRWRAFAESNSDLGGIPADRRHHAMREATARVREFAKLHGFDHVSVGIPYPSSSGYGEASVVQHGRDRHVSIGLTWLHQDAEHLAIVLEHELAHLRRAHGPRRRLRRAVGAALLVTAAWHLPPLGAAVAGIVLLVSGTALSWGEELACDLEARRKCGARAQAAMWRAQIIRDRATPRLRRWWDALTNARSHPPAHLRMLLGGVAAFRPTPGAGLPRAGRVPPPELRPSRSPQQLPPTP